MGSLTVMQGIWGAWIENSIGSGGDWVSKACVALPEPVQASHFVARRFNRAFVALNHDTVEQLCSMMRNIPGCVNGKRDMNCQLGALVPEPFAACYMQSMAQYVVVPCPKSKGWWRVEKWMLEMFNDDMLDAFRATQRPNPAGLATFSLSSCADLACDLRRVVQAILSGQEDRIFHRLCSLQERDDRLQGQMPPS